MTNWQESSTRANHPGGQNSNNGESSDNNYYTDFDHGGAIDPDNLGFDCSKVKDYIVDSYNNRDELRGHLRECTRQSKNLKPGNNLIIFTTVSVITHILSIAACIYLIPGMFQNKWSKASKEGQNPERSFWKTALIKLLIIIVGYIYISFSLFGANLVLFFIVAYTIYCQHKQNHNIFNKNNPNEIPWFAPFLEPKTITKKND